MREDLKQVRSDEDLREFMRRYEALRAEGLTNAVIAQRMGITPSGVNERRKQYRSRFPDNSTA